MTHTTPARVRSSPHRSHPLRDQRCLPTAVTRSPVAPRVRGWTLLLRCSADEPTRFRHRRFGRTEGFTSGSSMESVDLSQDIGLPHTLMRPYTERPETCLFLRCTSSDVRAQIFFLPSEHRRGCRQRTLRNTRCDSTQEPTYGRPQHAVGLRTTLGTFAYPEVGTRADRRASLSRGDGNTHQPRSPNPGSKNRRATVFDSWNPCSCFAVFVARSHPFEKGSGRDGAEHPGPGKGCLTVRGIPGW